MADTKRGKLPEDFPGYAALAEADITTYGQVRKVSDLETIPGIGPATAEKIRAEMGDTTDDDDAVDETGLDEAPELDENATGPERDAALALEREEAAVAAAENNDEVPPASTMVPPTIPENETGAQMTARLQREAGAPVQPI